jgi:hypothetical protein
MPNDSEKAGERTMPVGPIEPFVIENEHEADAYLRDLLANPDYRSMDEVRRREQNIIKTETLKTYFINRGQELLKS